MISCVHVVDMLNAYHRREYPEDGNWEDWYVSFAPVQHLDQYVLLIKYRQPPGRGDLFAKRTFSGLELHFYESSDGGLLIRRLRDDFDEMRMEIIEMLDGLQRVKEYGKKLMKSMAEPEFHFTESPPKTYEYKQYYIPVPKMTDNHKAQLYYEGLVA